MEHSQLNSAIKQHAFRKMQQIQIHLDVLSADVSVVILPSCFVHHHSGQFSPRHQPVSLKAPQAHVVAPGLGSSHVTHLPPRLSWMGAMSPSNPDSRIWTPSCPGSLRPTHLPPSRPLFVAPRSRKPRKENRLSADVARSHRPPLLLSSLAKPTPAPFGPQVLSHHGFFKEERWWCRRGQEGSFPCCPQGARRRQPVRHSQAPPGYSPSCSCQYSIGIAATLALLLAYVYTHELVCPFFGKS